MTKFEDTRPKESGGINEYRIEWNEYADKSEAEIIKLKKLLKSIKNIIINSVTDQELGYALDRKIISIKKAIK